MSLNSENLTELNIGSPLRNFFCLSQSEFALGTEQVQTSKKEKEF
jgi:hypothetical protein